MPTSLEVVNKSAVLVRIPEEHGNGVRVVLGGADGPLVTIDSNGRIRVLPSEGPGDPELRKAVSNILQGVQTMGRLAREATVSALAGAGN